LCVCCFYLPLVFSFRPPGGGGGGGGGGGHSQGYGAKMRISVVDPDPYDFGPPGSGSVSHRIRSPRSQSPGSSIIKQNKVRKPWIPTVLRLLYAFLSQKNM
jgi:hypothetical protein